LGEAAQARAKADWLVGFNLTRAYSAKHRTKYSVGRVQTPTLALVVERDRQIERFKPSHYYEVVAHLAPGFDVVHVRRGEPDDKGRTPWVRRIEERAEAEETAAAAAASHAAVAQDVETRAVRRRPPALFDLTTLQREANERFGWTAAQTLEAAQALYEAKVITYPRTECRHLPKDMRPQLAGLLETLSHPHAAVALDHLRREQGNVPDKAYIDSTKLTDHHAIIPTTEAIPSSISLDGRLGRLYALIVTRFLAIFFPDEVIEKTTARLEIGGHAFLASGRRQVQEGWRAVEAARGDESDDSTDDGQLPALRAGQTVKVLGAEVVKRKSAPPKRYTDATLLAAMMNAGRTIEDVDRAEVLKKVGGLGTPATRAGIIEVLVKRAYVIRKGKAVLSTDKGRALVEAVSEPLKSAELTAQWERELREIEAGNGTAAGFLEGITGLVRELLTEVHGSRAAVPERRNSHAKSIGPCPSCGKEVVDRGKAFGCSARRETGCGFRVWKVKSGKRLGATQVRMLLKKGRTGVIKGFRSKAGRPFEAALKLDGQNGVVFDFGDQVFSA
ncbi:MAG: DNA topoisomerase, partial [Candidatus Tectomicrobia bacterium]|nr:DNA topoisomerase [Candidatus Tectomicrobia bacterium]